MRIFKKLFSRMTITILFLILEIVIFGSMLIWFVNYTPVITIVSFILSIVSVLVLVRTDDTSAFKIAWIIVIMAVPLLGGILYALFGNCRPAKKMGIKVNKSHHEVSTYLMQQDDINVGSERVKGMMHSILKNSSYSVYNGTSTRYYPFGELMYADMLEELKKAEHYIFLEYFIIDARSTMWKGVLKILLEKASKGVDVRLIYDDVGCAGLFTMIDMNRLKSSNIKVIPFNPFVPALAVKMNNRDHRKILVIDGHTAFNGGINISDEYINRDRRFGIWKDTGIMLKGKAVKSFTLMFLEIWNAFCTPGERINDFTPHTNTGDIYEDDGFVLPYGDSPLDKERVGEEVYIEILNQATRYVTIFTPYLILSDKMILALQMAAKRGVNVSIVMPKIPDKKVIYRMNRSHYAVLLKHGVNIYEYTPGFIHAKSFICDDELAVVGTINLDFRSLYLHFECATLLYKTDSINHLRDDAIKTINESYKITIHDCERKFFGGLLDAILYVFAPLV